MKIRSFAALAALSIVPAFALARSQQDADKAYTLEFKYSANDLLKYKFDMNMLMNMKSANAAIPLPGEMEMVMSANMRMKTAGVKPDGTGVIVTQMTDGQMTVMGQPQNMPQTPPMTMEVDKQGKVQKMRGLENMPGGNQMAQMMNFNSMPGFGVVLPNHPIKVGDTWEDMVQMPMSEKKAKVVSTFLSTETVDGKETLKFKQVWTIPFEMKIGQGGPVKDEKDAMMVMTGEMNMNSLVNVLPNPVRVVKTAADTAGKITMDMKGDQIPGGGGKIDMDMKGKLTMSLVSAGKVEAPAPVKPAGKG